MMPKLKLLLFKCLAVLFGLIGFCLLAEVALRFAPVCESVSSLPVNASNPIYRCAPNRTVFLSAFWNFPLQNTIHVNNYGFVSDLDYDANDKRPLLAMVGDSYLEALFVPWQQTFAARLHQSLAPSARAYAFGKSGAALSQYLIYAQYAQENFKPSALIVVVVGNDFDQSLLKYKSAPGFHHFVKDDGGRLQLQRVDHEIGPTIKIIRHSALARYLLFNVDIQNAHKRAAYSLRSDQYVGNTPVDTGAVRIAESKEVVDSFLEYLPQMLGLSPANILFVLDGMRPDLYEPRTRESAEHSYFGIMRRYFSASVAARGFELIDMHPIFVAHYERHHEAFEFPREQHWNRLGHQLVAEAIVRSKVFARFQSGE